jgi:hypothetical protein
MFLWWAAAVAVARMAEAVAVAELEFRAQHSQ